MDFTISYNNGFVFSGKIQKGKQRLELMNSKPEGPPMTQAQTEKNQEQVNNCCYMKECLQFCIIFL